AEEESPRHPNHRCGGGDCCIEAEAGQAPRGLVDNLPDSSCSAPHSEPQIDKEKQLKYQPEKINAGIPEALESCPRRMRNQDASGDTKRQEKKQSASCVSLRREEVKSASYLRYGHIQSGGLHHTPQLAAVFEHCGSSQA